MYLPVQSSCENDARCLTLSVQVFHRATRPETCHHASAQRFKKNVGAIFCPQYSHKSVMAYWCYTPPGSWTISELLRSTNLGWPAVAPWVGQVCFPGWDGLTRQALGCESTDTARWSQAPALRRSALAGAEHSNDLPPGKPHFQWAAQGWLLQYFFS